MFLKTYKMSKIPVEFLCIKFSAGYCSLWTVTLGMMTLHPKMEDQDALKRLSRGKNIC